MRKLLKKFLFGLFLIPIYVYYIVKVSILVCKEPENGRSTEEILLETVRKDKQKLQEYSKRRFGA